MIKSKIFRDQKSISHYFFNRLGGTSKGIYKSLNCGKGSRDKITNISKNLKIVSKKIKDLRNDALIEKLSSSELEPLLNLPVSQ